MLGKPSVCRCGIGCFLADSCATSERLLVNREGAPDRTALMLTRADSYHRAGARSGADDDVIRARRAVEEVPLSQPPLLALDDEKRLARKDEKVLLVGLPVVHRHGLTRPEHANEHPHLRKLSRPLEFATRGHALALEPRRLASVQDKPALPGRRKTALRLCQRCLGNHPPIIRWPVCGWALLLDGRLGQCSRMTPERASSQRSL